MTGAGSTGLEGSSVVVTGAGSGIGRAAALRFAAEGARVVVADIDAERADAVVGEIEAAGGTAVADPGEPWPGCVQPAAVARFITAPKG